MANFTYLAIDDFFVREPYFSISLADYNLTPVPPKYINSINVTRLANGASGNYTIQLTAPTSTFSVGSDSLTLVLTTLLAQSQTANEDEKPRLNFVYGWKNGAQCIATGAIVDKFDFSYSNEGTIITYTIGGPVQEIRPNTYSTDIYNRVNTVASNDIEELGNITKLTDSENQLSKLIERIAKYLFPGYTIDVDHSDRTYSGEQNLNSSAFNVSIKPDGASQTLLEYFERLVRACKEWKPNDNPKTVITYGDKFVYEKDGVKYISYDENVPKYDPNGTSNVDYPFNSVSVVSTGTAEGRRGKLDTVTLKLEDGSEVKFTEMQQQHLGTETVINELGGEYGNNFDVVYDHGKKHIKISPNCQGENIKSYVISNNSKSNEVISFNISSAGIAATSAIMGQINSGATYSVDVSSGLSIGSTTNLGGLVPLSQIDLEQLYESYQNSLAETISSHTSEGSLVVYGSQFTVDLDIVSTQIRILPLINGGETFWCGDYTIMGITDSVDSSGYTTTLTVKFAKSKFSEDFNNATYNQGTTKSE